MHVRLSSSLGLPIVEKNDDHVIGIISGILINPDSGKIEGFYAKVPGLMASGDLFFSALDTVKWGTRVSIQDREVLSPANDRIRLKEILEDPRTVLGQKVLYENGKKLGVCKDVQFDTDKMVMTWIFPKKFFGWGMAIPAKEIKEIKKDKIIVCDPKVTKKVEEEESIDPVETLEKIADPKIVRPG